MRLVSVTLKRIELRRRVKIDREVYFAGRVASNLQSTSEVYCEPVRKVDGAHPAEMNVVIYHGNASWVAADLAIMESDADFRRAARRLTEARGSLGRHLVPLASVVGASAALAAVGRLTTAAVAVLTARGDDDLLGRVHLSLDADGVHLEANDGQAADRVTWEQPVETDRCTAVFEISVGLADVGATIASDGAQVFLEELSDADLEQVYGDVVGHKPGNRTRETQVREILAAGAGPAVPTEEPPADHRAADPEELDRRLNAAGERMLSARAAENLAANFRGMEDEALRTLALQVLDGDWKELDREDLIARLVAAELGSDPGGEA